MAPRRSWADLTIDLVAGIAARVPCLADRVHAAWACRTWCEGVLLELDPPPPQLPWLLRPFRSPRDLKRDGIPRALFFCVLCDRIHCAAVPDYTRGARFFGAYPGGWLFLAYGQNFGHGLVNLRTHEWLELPDHIAWNGFLLQPAPMFIRAATLSAPPLPRQGCVAAAIVTFTIVTPAGFYFTSLITFWRMGSRVASCAWEMNAEDVIYHNGAFHFLNRQGDYLVVCTPQFQNEAPLEHLQVRAEIRMLPIHVPHDGARYLVECRGELLMVLRLQPPQQATLAFRVFRFRMTQNHDPYDWSELPALDGRMLFVGRGCSRSFEAAHFPGSQEGVYFLDDGNFHEPPMIWGGHVLGSYGRCNNGVCSGPPDHAVRRWFPEQHPSTYSSPVWFFH